MNTTSARPWALLFLVSLGFNLFFAGVLTARFLHRPNPSQSLAPFGSPGIGRALDADARPVAARIWTSHKGEVVMHDRKAREAKVRARRVLSANPFDQAKALQALADVRETAAAFDSAVHEALVELARDLPADQRAKLGNALLRGRGPLGPKMRPWMDKLYVPAGAQPSDAGSSATPASNASP